MDKCCMNNIENLKNLPKFEYFANLIPQPVLCRNLNYEIVFINNYAAKAAKLDSEKDWFGVTAFDVYPYDIAIKLINNQKSVIESLEVKTFEEMVENNKTKEVNFFNATISPWYDDNGVLIGTCCISIDITAKKKYEMELIEKKNQLEKKLEYQKSYLKSYGYDWVFSLKKMSNALDGMNKRLLQFDVPLSVRDDLCPEFRDSNEALSEIYTMYQNMNASILEQDNEDSVLNEMQIEFDEFIKTEVSLANSKIDAKYDKKIVLDIEDQLKTKLYVDHKKLRHILRTLFANFIQGITERNNIDIMLNIAAQDDNNNDKLYVTFSFSGNMPFLEVCDDNIRAEYIVYPKTIDTHNFSYEVSRAMYYANLLCGDEDLNKTLFEGKSFSFVLPFKKFDKPQPKEFKPFVV